MWLRKCEEVCIIYILKTLEHFKYLNKIAPESPNLNLASEQLLKQKKVKFANSYDARRSVCANEYASIGLPLRKYVILIASYLAFIWLCMLECFGEMLSRDTWRSSAAPRNITAKKKTADSNN